MYSVGDRVKTTASSSRGSIASPRTAVYVLRYDTGGQAEVLHESTQRAGAATIIRADGFWRTGSYVQALWEDGRVPQYPGFYGATVRSVKVGYRVRFDRGLTTFTEESALAPLPASEEM